MKIAIILGTRPEIIKMASVIRACQEQGLDYYIIHTGQHYSYELDGIFFKELNLPRPDFNIEIGSGTHAEETAKAMMGIEKILMNKKPDIALVHSDTNTTLAGALAASKLHIKIGHVESGLRSRDRAMPEEINRILADHISDFLFTPTEKTRANLLGEGIASEKIFVTGNTIVDAVYQNLEIARDKAKSLNELNLKRKGYFLVTLHRQENADYPNRFQGILDGLGLIAREFALPVIYPVHPRAEKRIREHGLKIPQGVRLIQPVGFLDFLKLEENARLVLTDSGGIQEEACILQVPCVTLRDNTERPETLDAGSNILSGSQPDSILNSAKLMLQKPLNWHNPFGDGTAGKQMVKILMEKT